jgi:hypothetical protein
MTLEQKLSATIIETGDLNCKLMGLIAHTSEGPPDPYTFGSEPAFTAGRASIRSSQALTLGHSSSDSIPPSACIWILKDTIKHSEIRQANRKGNLPREGFNISDTIGTFTLTREILAICETEFDYTIESFNLV